jgi:hypothetical protein
VCITGAAFQRRAWFRIAHRDAERIRADSVEAESAQERSSWLFVREPKVYLFRYVLFRYILGSIVTYGIKNVASCRNAISYIRLPKSCWVGRVMPSEISDSVF